MENVEPISSASDIHVPSFNQCLMKFSVPSLTDPNVNAYQILPEKFNVIREQIKNLAVYEDDVWIAGHPKTGTSWLQEMVWLINNNLGYKIAAEKKITERFPFIE